MSDTPVSDERLRELIHVATFSAFKASAMHELELALRELLARREADAKPDGYAYVYSTYNGRTIRFDGGREVNGTEPYASIGYRFIGEIPAAPGAAT